MRAKKTILFITVTFPPRLSVASLRLYHYAKLFSDNGWSVHVLTCSQKGEKISDEFDLNGLNIKHVDWIDPFDFTFKIKNLFLRKVFTKGLSFFIPYLASWWPDLRFRSWRKNTILQAIELIEKEQITHVYSSFSPPSSHMVAHKLKKMNKHIVWMAEFRDLMSFSHANNKVEDLIAPLHNLIEKKILSNANFIFCDTKGHADFMRIKLKREINVLYNGCQFKNYKLDNRIVSNEFKITFTGNLYRRTNDIQLFLKAFSIWINSIEEPRVSINFIGTNKSKYILELIKRYKLSNYVNFITKQPNYVVRELQVSSSILLHFCWNKLNQNGNISGKLFEYISSRQPILSIGYESEVDEILSNTSSGKCCSNEDDIIQFLNKNYFYPNKSIILDDESCIYSKLNQFRNLEKIILTHDL